VIDFINNSQSTRLTKTDHKIIIANIKLHLFIAASGKEKPLDKIKGKCVCFNLL
jgi:hypothetical protein